MSNQLHAGTRAKKSEGRNLYPGNKVWHTNFDNTKYWSGTWYERTPAQLLKECRSIIRDLLKNHPELK
jgi:hypothetical protein